jgi:hypothetical protein
VCEAKVKEERSGRARGTGAKRSGALGLPPCQRGRRPSCPDGKGWWWLVLRAVGLPPVRAGFDLTRIASLQCKIRHFSSCSPPPYWDCTVVFINKRKKCTRLFRR